MDSTQAANVAHHKTKQISTHLLRTGSEAPSCRPTISQKETSTIYVERLKTFEKLIKIESNNASVLCGGLHVRCANQPFPDETSSDPFKASHYTHKLRNSLTRPTLLHTLNIAQKLDEEFIVLVSSFIFDLLDDFEANVHSPFIDVLTLCLGWKK